MVLTHDLLVMWWKDALRPWFSLGFYCAASVFTVAAFMKSSLPVFLLSFVNSSKPPPPRKKFKPPVATRPKNLAKVLYDYDAQDTDELQLREGDVLEVLVKGLCYPLLEVES